MIFHQHHLSEYSYIISQLDKRNSNWLKAVIFHSSWIIYMQTACDQVEGLTATIAQQQAPQSMMFHRILWPQHLYLGTSGEVGENWKLWKEKYIEYYFIISRSGKVLSISSPCSSMWSVMMGLTWSKPPVIVKMWMKATGMWLWVKWKGIALVK